MALRGPIRPETRLPLAAWFPLLDTLADAVLLLDGAGQVLFANGAAAALFPGLSGQPLQVLAQRLGEVPTAWLQAALRGGPRAAEPPRVELPDGRHFAIAWRRLDSGEGVLRLAPITASAAAEAPAVVHAVDPTVRFIWESPFPATLQDADFRLVDVNPAYVALTGRTRESLIGRDPIELQPPEDQPSSRAAREAFTAQAGDTHGGPLFERRLLDADGRERWYRATRQRITDAQGRELLLVVMQDSTAEHVARDRADRSARELDQWFDLSPMGMVLFDDRGLLVRSNPAFEALVGSVPVTLPEADESLQQLLCWQGGAADALLQPGAPPLERQVWMPRPDGSMLRLRSIVRCYKSPGGHRRHMAVVEDRSVEEERDLAQVQIGAMMDTAGVGLATFQESLGWVRQRQTGGGGSGAPSALQAIGRDVVLPESIPEYERLQRALRLGERAEVRYAVRHPELGERWLLTRVEPAVLASGKRTTSVVTLDVTEQEQARSRSDELLREMSNILESTVTGIAQLRGGLLVRCNHRFEAMLGIAPGSAAGRELPELFGQQPQVVRIAADAQRTLGEGEVLEAEFEFAPPGLPLLWYGLSLRRTDGRAGVVELIAVLSDITRLKLQQTELELAARDRELMFSLSEVGIASVRGGRIQRANEALAQLAGWPVQDLASLTLSTLYADPADYLRRWPAQERELRASGRWSGEMQLRRRDGQLLWAQLGLRLVSQADPAAGFIASFVNVDARHRAELAVALQAERTRAILDSVLVGIVTVGASGIEWMNRSARRMFGGDLADFLNQPISTVATPEPTHPFRRTHYLEELAEGQAETFECRVKARDGREFWVVGNAVATSRESTGRQLTYALLDIERRRQAEARMSEAQASLQRIIEAAPMAITLRDARTLKILQVNQVAARTAQSTAEQLIGLTPEQVFDAATAAQRRADMEAALASRELTQREYRVETDGATQVWDTRYLPLATQPGQPPDQLLLVSTDVTEQRAAQEARFEAAIAQREMLVKEVHHRIKNNLQGVAGLLQQIAQRKPEVAGVMSEVIGQVQAIAQVYGLQVGVTGPLRVKSVVEAIAGSVQRTFGRTIRFELEGPVPHRWALPEAESIPIALTLNELLTNAVKHSAGDEVACTLHCDETGVRIAIGNAGRLPEGFNLARVPGGVSGLGLVRALLPRRSASLTIEQQGERVLAIVALDPPSITRLDPA
ncbi:PAS domain S-box protein [Variovorax sp. YR752]|uniref:PAS domain S-box protein n=1 Tax=Variovorax sp. YR752 TaxID=1884383 RepID=UPI003137BD73